MNDYNSILIQQIYDARQMKINTDDELNHVFTMTRDMHREHISRIVADIDSVMNGGININNESVTFTHECTYCATIDCGTRVCIIELINGDTGECVDLIMDDEVAYLDPTMAEWYGVLYEGWDDILEKLLLIARDMEYLELRRANERLESAKTARHTIRRAGRNYRRALKHECEEEDD